MDTKNIFLSLFTLLVLAPGMTCVLAPALAADEAQIKALMDEYDAGKNDLAYKRCIGILKANPQNMTAHYYMGNLYLRYNKLDQAEAEYKYCAAAGADSPEAQSAQQGLQAVAARRAMPAQTASAAPELGSDGVDARTQEQIDRIPQRCSRADQRQKKN